MRERLVWAAHVVVLAVGSMLLVGCTVHSARPTEPPSSSTAVRPVRTASRTSHLPARSSASRTPSPVSVQRCRARWLAPSQSFRGSAMGEIGYALRFRNISHQTCYLGGWPRIRGTQNHRRVVLVAHTSTSMILIREHAQPHPILLRPGAAAYIAINGSILNHHGQLCRATVSILQVKLPTPGPPFTIRVHLSPYTGLAMCVRLSATPLVAAPQILKQYRVPRPR